MGLQCIRKLKIIVRFMADVARFRLANPELQMFGHSFPSHLSSYRAPEELVSTG